MRLLLYGYDNVAKAILPPIAVELSRRGHKPLIFPAQQRGVVAEQMEELYECDLGLLNLASSQTQEELTAFAVLAALGKPVVIIADIPGAEFRRKARPFAPHTSGVIIPLENGRRKAEVFGYPADRIRRIIPPHWGRSYGLMRQAVMRGARRRLVKRVNGAGNAQALDPDDVVVFVPGAFKEEPTITNRILRLTIASGRTLLGNRFVLGFAPHPGERPEYSEDEERFRQAFAERAEILSGTTTTNIGEMANPERYAVADLVITSGGSNESITAAYARNDRMLYYTDDLAVAVLHEAGYEGVWFVAELRAAHKVNPDSFRSGFERMLTEEGRAEVQREQEENFPLPETWDTAPAIADFLEELAPR